VPPRSQPEISSGFHSRSVILNQQEYRYQVYIPPGYTSQQAWPIVLFLHGSGVCGTDGAAPAEGALGAALTEHPDRYPCLVVFPQSRDIDYWTGKMETMALAILDRTIREFHGDPHRTYLTGNSMGGAGTWFLAALHQGRFAAVAPICGRIAIQPQRAHSTALRRWVESRDPYARIAERIGRTPVWIFHGNADPIVPVGESRNMAAALKALGGNVRYTEYPLVGHDAWDRAYGDPAFPRWLLAQRT